MNSGDVWIIMKKYKIGDTIYVKDTVADIDTDDNDMTYRGSRCGWLYKSNVVDELPTAEPVKPVLPKGVADEITEWRNSPHYVAEDTYFDQLIYEMISNSVESCLVKTRNSFIGGDIGIKTLLDAWYNGYTVEKEPKYLVKVPTSWNNSSFQQYFQLHGKDMIQAPRGIATEFTNEELKKYELDKFEKEPVADD